MPAPLVVPAIGKLVLGAAKGWGTKVLGTLFGAGLIKYMAFAIGAVLLLVVADIDELGWTAINALLGALSTKFGSVSDGFSALFALLDTQWLALLRWLMDITAIWNVLCILAFAWGIRFLIRRIPFIG